MVVFSQEKQEPDYAWRQSEKYVNWVIHLTDIWEVGPLDIYCGHCSTIRHFFLFLIGSC